VVKRDKDRALYHHRMCLVTISGGHCLRRTCSLPRAHFNRQLLSQVIRVVRHPERYARNEAGFTGGPGGTLTRAILDTFPVIKFHSTSGRTEHDDAEKADTPPRDSLYEMGVLPDEDKKVVLDTEHTLPELRAGEGDEPTSSDDEQPVASPSSVQVRPRLPPAHSAAAQEPSSDPMPDQIGRETCPICIVDFEDGDDMRVLPCEGQHRFHQTYVKLCTLASRYLTFLALAAWIRGCSSSLRHVQSAARVRLLPRATSLS
jgi:hypothetical protein